MSSFPVYLRFFVQTVIAYNNNRTKITWLLVIEDMIFFFLVLKEQFLTHSACFFFFFAILVWNTVFPLENKGASTLCRRILAALFLRFALPFTLIRRENGAFRKRSSNQRNLKTPPLWFNVNRNRFENGAFGKRWHYDIQVISEPKFFSNTNSKLPAKCHAQYINILTWLRG